MTKLVSTRFKLVSEFEAFRDLFPGTTEAQWREIDAEIAAMTPAELFALCSEPRPIKIVVADWEDVTVPLLPRERKHLKARGDALRYGLCAICKAVLRVENGVATFAHHKLCPASDRRAARITRRIDEKHKRVPRQRKIAVDPALWASVTSYIYDEGT